MINRNLHSCSWTALHLILPPTHLINSMIYEHSCKIFYLNLRTVSFLSIFGGCWHLSEKWRVWAAGEANLAYLRREKRHNCYYKHDTGYSFWVAHVMMFYLWSGTECWPGQVNTKSAETSRPVSIRGKVKWYWVVRERWKDFQTAHVC